MINLHRANFNLKIIFAGMTVSTVDIAGVRHFASGLEKRVTMSAAQLPKGSDPGCEDPAPAPGAGV